MEIKKEWLPLLLPLLLNKEQCAKTQSEIEILTENPSIRNQSVVGWGNLAHQLRIPNELREDVQQLRQAIFALVSLSNQYIARQDLLRRLEVQELIPGTSITHGTLEAKITGFHEDGRIWIEYLDPREKGQKRRIAANPNSCFPSNR